MSNLIYCLKSQREAEPLTQAPYPGELGEKILNNISAEAWQQWIERQTMLINEYRLSLIDPKARSFLKDEMQKFLFEDTDVKPEGYKPED